MDMQQKKRVKEVIQHYFSDANWSRDLYLQRISEENGGCVPISELVKFGKIKSMQDEYLGNSASSAARVKHIHTSLLAPTSVEIVPMPTTGELAVRRKSLRLQVRDVLEYYFGDLNFPRDDYLRELASESDGEWVNLVELKSWPRMRALLLRFTRPEEIALTVLDSAVVEVSDDKQSVRKRGVLFQEPEYINPVPIPMPIPAQMPRVGSFSVMQFNILAQMLAPPDHYPYVDAAVLQWRYRFPRIIYTIKSTSCDLICLQEVQGNLDSFKRPSDNHRYFIERELRSSGYEGIYARKTTTRNTDLGNQIFYRTSAFELLAQHVYHYEDLIPQIISNMHGSQKGRYARGKQLAIVLHLRYKANGKRLLLANTHISCDFKNPDRQMAQIYALTQALQALSRDAGGIPVIISGDFNVMPDSEIYQFLNEGRLHGSAGVLDSPDPDVARIFPASAAGISCDQLHLASAYKTHTGEEPALTNKKGSPVNFSGCLDYIWHSTGSSGLRVVEVLPTPDEGTLGAEGGGIPSSEFPSDHIPIAANFSFV